VYRKVQDVLYPEGDYSLLEFIAKNIQYPVSAVEGRITGIVYFVAFFF